VMGLTTSAVAGNSGLSLRYPPEVSPHFTLVNQPPK
jgi:hypothetical protein